MLKESGLSFAANPMNSIAYLSILAWFPTVFLMFCYFKVERAVLMSLIAGWLFLPVFSFSVQVDKAGVVPLVTFAFASIFGFLRLFHFVFRPVDLLALAMCASPVLSSLSNGLGLYDGMSQGVDRFVEWGLPYFLGRLFFSSREMKRELVLAVFLGGLVYVPLCLYEVRMSPQLHTQLYGYFPHQFAQTMRFGGWRPQVFMHHGLMLALWMSSASLAGLWCWRAGILRDRKAKIAVVALILTTVACKSALALMVLGIVLGVLHFSQKLKTRLLVLILVALPLLYVGARTAKGWKGGELVNAATSHFGADRAQSLSFRFFNESFLLEHAKKRKWFGWGGWGRSLVPTGDSAWARIAIPDSLWILIFGSNGLVGLFLLFGCLTVPLVRFFRLYPPSSWATPSVAPTAALAGIISMCVIDNLFNAFLTPLFMLIVGAVSGEMEAFQEEGPSLRRILLPAARALGLAVPSPAPLRIAYLVNQYPTVSHTFIRTEIAALEQRGFRIQRYSLRNTWEGLLDSGDKAEWEKTRRVLDHGILRLPLACLIGFVTHPVRWTNALTTAIAMGRKSDRGVPRHLAYLMEACLLSGWLKQSKTDHIHAHFGTNSAAVALLTHLLSEISYSFTVHGPEEFDRAAGLSLALKIDRARFVVVVSEFGKSQLYRWCNHDKWPKIKVVRCGVGWGFLDHPRAAIPVGPRLVSVGRLCEQKGQILLLAAARALVTEGVPLELVFVGDGELRGQLESLVEQWDLGNHVKILGWCDREKTRREILGSRALVLPSFAEGLPLVLVEAMALGRPVISTFVAGIPELVVHGSTGWLCPAGAVGPLVDAMRAAITAPVERLEGMGREGTARVATYHNINIESARLAGLFMEQSGRDGARTIEVRRLRAA